jgi:hypothetical protein
MDLNPLEFPASMRNDQTSSDLKLRGAKALR